MKTLQTTNEALQEVYRLLNNTEFRQNLGDVTNVFNCIEDQVVDFEIEVTKLVWKNQAEQADLKAKRLKFEEKLLEMTSKLDEKIKKANTNLIASPNENLEVSESLKEGAELEKQEIEIFKEKSEEELGGETKESIHDKWQAKVKELAETKIEVEIEDHYFINALHYAVKNTGVTGRRNIKLIAQISKELIEIK